MFLKHFGLKKHLKWLTNRYIYSQVSTLLRTFGLHTNWFPFSNSQTDAFVCVCLCARENVSYCMGKFAVWGLVTEANCFSQWIFHIILLGLWKRMKQSLWHIHIYIWILLTGILLLIRNTHHHKCAQYTSTTTRSAILFTHVKYVFRIRLRKISIVGWNDDVEEKLLLSNTSNIQL